MSNISLPYIAGLYEGEGSFFAFSRKKGDPKNRAKATIQMNDEDIIKCIADFNNTSAQQRKDNKSYFTNIHDSRALDFMESVYPYMGKRRKHQIGEVFQSLGFSIKPEITSKRVNKDINWLSGLLEGEGSFCLVKTKGQNKRVPKVIVASKDKDVIQEASTFMNNMSVVESKTKGGKCIMFFCTLTGKKALNFSRDIYNRMGNRRKAQIENLFSEGYANYVL